MRPGGWAGLTSPVAYSLRGGALLWADQTAVGSRTGGGLCIYLDSPPSAVAQLGVCSRGLKGHSLDTKYQLYKRSVFAWINLSHATLGLLSKRPPKFCDIVIKPLSTFVHSEGMNKWQSVIVLWWRSFYDFLCFLFFLSGLFLSELVKYSLKLEQGKKLWEI